MEVRIVNIIVLFPRLEDAGNVRSLLVRHGFRVSAVCTTGAQALAQAFVPFLQEYQALPPVATPLPARAFGRL